VSRSRFLNASAVWVSDDGGLRASEHNHGHQPCDQVIKERSEQVDDAYDWAVSGSQFLGTLIWDNVSGVA
jgi:hypothetical protein